MTDLFKYISAEDLMERWGLKPYQLQQLPIRGYIKKYLHSYYTEPGVPEHEYEKVAIYIGDLDPDTLLRCQFKLSDVRALEEELPELGKKNPKKDDSKEKKKRPSQLAKKQCREIAGKLWKEHYIISKEMAGRPEIIKVAGDYAPETRRRWICDLAPKKLQKGGTPTRKSSK